MNVLLEPTSTGVDSFSIFLQWDKLPKFVNELFFFFLHKADTALNEGIWLKCFLFWVVLFINFVQQGKYDIYSLHINYAAQSYTKWDIWTPATEPELKHIFLVIFCLFSLTPPFCDPWSPVKVLNSVCLHASLLS